MTRLPFEVFVFVRRGDEFLVAHRVPSGGSYWHGIAGGVEKGETFAEAAGRELFEETGYTGAVEPLGASFRYDEVTVQPFIVDVPAGWEPRLNEEHDEYRWCSREDAVELLYWPEPKELLRTLA